jgi:hypothetical protein
MLPNDLSVFQAGHFFEPPFADPAVGVLEDGTAKGSAPRDREKDSSRG